MNTICCSCAPLVFAKVGKKRFEASVKAIAEYTEHDQRACHVCPCVCALVAAVVPLCNHAFFSKICFVCYVVHIT